MAWLRPVERLSRSQPSAVTDAQMQLRQLVSAARAVSPPPGDDPSQSCDPEHPCRPQECPLAAEPEGASLCRLARRLALLDVTDVTPAAASGQPVARLRAEVAEAVDLVRTCRQTAHPAGVCWLSHPDGREGCSELLRLAHRTTARAG